MVKNAKTSIIIRTKDEERWIGHCLKAVFSQKYRDFEVVIVDNNSQDGTIKKALQYPVKNVSISNYTPGRALNLGVENSVGDILVFLSGHCIPSDENWLGNLVSELSGDNIAGVYGRQLPMSFSSPQAKRDLLITFGLDRKVQVRDSFFHNANSAIRRKIWDKIKFDEKVSNIEDRFWAKNAIEDGYNIIYTPEACVFHHHGIHHDNDRYRLSGTATIIEQKGFSKSGKLDPLNTSCISIIPVKGDFISKVQNISILDSTINYSRASKYIKDTIVLTDSPAVKEYSEAIGAKVPFLRNSVDSESIYDLNMVYGKYYEKIEDGLRYHPDIVISLEPNYLVRPPNLIQDMLILLINNGYDSVVPGFFDYNWTWKNETGENIVVDSLAPRDIKEPLFRSMKGVGCASHPEYFRGGQMLGSNVGLLEVSKLYGAFEVRGKEDVVGIKNIIKGITSVFNEIGTLGD